MTSPAGVHTVRVRCTGDRSGAWPATLAQAGVLEWVSEQPTAAIVAGIAPLPDGTTLADVERALVVLLSRHEGLRTRFRTADDGRVMQVVAGEAYLDVELRPVTDDGAGRPGRTPDHQPGQQTPRRLVEPFSDRPIDHGTELPIRVRVELVGSQPRVVLFDISHVAADMAAVDIVVREFIELVGDPGGRPTGPPVRQPVEQALDECSERGRRRLAATMRYWEQRMRSLPGCVLPDSDRTALDSGLVLATLASRSAASAATAAATRLSVSASTVLIAGVAGVLSSWTGSHIMPIHLTCSNRFLPGMDHYVGAVAQEALLDVDCQAASFDALVRRVQVAVIRGCRHGYYDVRAMTRRTWELAHERGVLRHRDVVVNDVGAIVDRDAASTCTTHADPDTSARVGFETRDTGASAALQFTILGYQPELTLRLGCPSGGIPRPVMEGLLLGIDRLVHAAADGDVVAGELAERTGIRQLARPAARIPVNGGIVDVAAVQRLLQGVVGGVPARVFVVPAPDGGAELEAYVGPGMAVRDIHAGCVARLDGIHGVMAPHRYVVAAAPPTALDDVHRWRAATILEAGTGR